jgi:hypothetical protein
MPTKREGGDQWSKRYKLPTYHDTWYIVSDYCTVHWAINSIHQLYQTRPKREGGDVWCKIYELSTCHDTWYIVSDYCTVHRVISSAWNIMIKGGKTRLFTSSIRRAQNERGGGMSFKSYELFRCHETIQ